MKKVLLSIVTVLLTTTLFCKEEEVDQKTLSKIMGHLIGKNLKSTPITFDKKAFFDGLQESFEGKTPPFSEEKCLELLSVAHEKAHKMLAEKNLKEAETFLSKNAQKKEIVELEKGKLQYHIEKIGKGNIVESYNTPLIRYKGTYLDGTSFSFCSEPERVCLQETIPGFRKAITGMKEGEVRTVFIHPTLGYGDTGSLLPNSLLTYEIEILKADTKDDHFPHPGDKLITSQEELEVKE